MRQPDCSKLALNRKNGNDVTIFRHDVIVRFFPRYGICQVMLLIQVLCQYHYCSGVMTIFVYKRLTRNLEIGNTHVWVLPIVWVLPNIWRPGRVRDPNLSQMSNEKLLYDAKCQGYSFYRFWVLRENQDGGKSTPPPHTHTHPD